MSDLGISREISRQADHEPTGCGEPQGCAGTRPLATRPLISPIQAGGLAAVFKVLANETRLRLLHALIRAGELCVTDLATSVGMRPQAVSNQLQRLSDLGILASRREGNNIFYRVVDRCVAGLLDQGWCLIEQTRPDSPVSDARTDNVTDPPTTKPGHAEGDDLPSCCQDER